MYKILHLFRIFIFTENFINFINTNFDQNMHEFWVYGDRKNSNSGLQISLYKNVRYVNNIENKLTSKEVCKYDKIIYHGIFEQSIVDVFFQNKTLLKKLYIYFWGGDKFLYGNNMQIYRKRNVVNNAHAIINIIPEERQFMKKNYNIKGKFYCAQYEPHKIIEQCEKLQKNEIEEKIK